MRSWLRRVSPTDLARIVIGARGIAADDSHAGWGRLVVQGTPVLVLYTHEVGQAHTGRPGDGSGARTSATDRAATNADWTIAVGGATRRQRARLARLSEKRWRRSGVRTPGTHRAGSLSARWRGRPRGRGGDRVTAGSCLRVPPITTAPRSGDKMSSGRRSGRSRSHRRGDRRRRRRRAISGDPRSSPRVRPGGGPAPRMVAYNTPHPVSPTIAAGPPARYTSPPRRRPSPPPTLIRSARAIVVRVEVSPSQASVPKTDADAKQLREVSPARSVEAHGQPHRGAAHASRT